MKILIKENLESPEIGVCNKGEEKDIPAEIAQRLIQRGLAEETIKAKPVKAKMEDK